MIAPTQTSVGAAATAVGAPLPSGVFSLALSTDVACAVGFTPQVTLATGFLIPANGMLTLPINNAASAPVQLYAISGTTSKVSMWVGA